MVRGTNKRARRRGGFTLLEALVALIMFTVIMFAIGMALTTAMRAQVTSENAQTDNGNVRSVFDSLERDIAGAVVSTTDTQAAFVSGSSSSSSTTSSSIGGGSVLTLETRTQRILSTDPNLSDDPTITSSGVFSGSSSTTNPEYDALFVRYDLDPHTGNLTRTILPVPNGQLLTGPASQPSVVVGRNIVSISFQFWDSNQQIWRTDWDYEEPNIIAAATSAATSSGTTAGASAATTAATPSQASLAPTTTNSQTNGDMILPLAVQVSMVVRRSDGTPLTYNTTIAIPAPIPINSAPPTTTAPAPGSSGTTGVSG